MDPLPTAGAIATVVGLICNFRQEKGATATLNRQQFIEWLDYHRHEEIKNLICNTASLQGEVDKLLRGDLALIIQKLDAIIDSQNDKAKRIIQFKDKLCWLKLTSKSGFWYDLECTVRACDTQSLTLCDNESRLLTFPITTIEIQQTPMRDLEILAAPTCTEEEHIREIVHRWARFRKPPAPGEYHLTSNCLVNQLLANPSRVLPTVATLADSSENLWLRLLHLHVRFAVKKSERSTPRHQKIRRLEARFHEMKGQFAVSNLRLIGAAVHSTVEVATSLAECEEFLKHLATQHAGLAQASHATLWNALLWELNR